MNLRATTFAFCVCLAAIGASAQTVTLRYDPPVGTTWIRTSQRFIKETTRENVEKPTITETKMVSRVAIEGTGTGFCLSEVLTQDDEKINGQPFANPTRTVLIGRTNQTFVSRDGEVIDVSDNADMIEALKKVLPPSVHPTLERELEKGAALQTEKFRWQMSTKRFLNKPLNEGDTWTETFHSASGQHFVTTRVHKIAQVNGRTLVTLLYASSAQPGEVEGLDLSQPTAILQQKFLLARPAQVSTTFSRVLGSTVFDAETALLRKDEKISYDLERGPKGPVVRNVTRIETFDPAK